MAAVLLSMANVSSVWKRFSVPARSLWLTMVFGKTDFGIDAVDENKILDDFRSGHQNVAEFWINFQNKFVHIRYFVVRNDEGQYLGTVELTQNLAPLRQLSGERRLLAYESTEV